MNVGCVVTVIYLLLCNGKLCLAALAAVSATTVILSTILREKNRRTRKVLTREWLNPRHLGRGLINMVETELRTEDPNAYQNFLRMGSTEFDKLLHSIQEDISKTNTNMRGTSCFLATGETNRMPSTAAEWNLIATGFQKEWNFPLYIGAMDGKHIHFCPPTSAGSYYYNYKGHYSIVLLALADADYKLTYISVGANGRISDGGVYRESDLKEALDANLLLLPNDECLPGQTEKSPYVIVADEAFPLTQRIMKPFTQRCLTQEKRVYNYRLSRAHRFIENTFEILANRFRILLNTINLSPDKVENIVLACCVLHNFLATENQNRYLGKAVEEMNSNTDNMHSLQQNQGSNRSVQEALKIRENFMLYFDTAGAVDWQYRYIGNVQ